MLDAIDNLLNSYTMYRVVLYGLGLLLAIAALLGFTGAISISAGGLILSVLVLTVACYLSNKALSLFAHVPTNTESWLISVLILACILPQADSASKVFYTALVGAVAMTSKFVIRYHGNHLLNPAAFGAFVGSLSGLLPATWWIATPWLTPFTLLLALAVLRKQRNFELFAIFVLASAAMLVLTGAVLQGVGLIAVLHTALVSWPIIFFGSIMLTEPATLPPTRYYRLLLGVIVGLLFTSQLHASRLSTTPQAVLLTGNILAALIIPTYSYLLRLKRVRELSPDVYEVSFARPMTLNFVPGQHAELTLPMAGQHTDDRGNRRTFSIASARTEPVVRFIFRVSAKGSAFKRAMLRQKPGDILRLSQISGDFTLPEDDTEPLLLIAGGIGITPYLSMIGSLTAPRDIVLLHVTSAGQDIAFQKESDKASRFGVRTEHMQSRLSPENLQKAVPDLVQRLIYISGPDAMVRSSKAMLISMDLKRSDIKTDYFSRY